MKMFCNICLSRLSPAYTGRRQGLLGAMERRYSYWNCRTSVSQAVRLQSREFGSIGIFNTDQSIGLFSGTQKMCLYKPDNFAWNGTLPSKQSIVLPDGRGSAS